MKYNKKILLGLAIVIVIVLVVLLIVTRLKADKKREEEYNKLVDNLCKISVELVKENENIVKLERIQGEVAYINLKELSTLTIGTDNRVPLRLENPKTSTDTKRVYFSDTMAVKLIVDANNQVECSGIIDQGEPPEITLKGEENVTLKLGEEYVEPGYTAIDKEDGDLTNRVLKNGFPNTNERGEYEIIYLLEDSMKNITSKIRTISVK